MGRPRDASIDDAVLDATLHRLADAGASFLDDQGNAHLSLDGRTVLFAQTDKPVRRDTHAKVTGLQPQAKRAPGALALNRASHRVAFALLANPDLAARTAAHLPWAEPDASTFYQGGASGYTDYPAAP